MSKKISPLGIAIVLTAALSASMCGIYFASPSETFVILAVCFASLTAALAIANVVVSRSPKLSEREEIVADMLAKMTSGDIDRRSSSADVDDQLISAAERLRSTLNDTLSGVAAGIENSGKNISKASSLAEGLVRDTAQQGDSVRNIEGAVIAVNETADSNSANAREASKNVSAAADEMRRSGERVRKLMSDMENIRKSAEELSRAVKAADEIASRAGALASGPASDGGRGGASKNIAVPAEEMKALAARAKEVSQSASSLMNSLADSVRSGSDSASDTEKAFSSVSEKVTAAAGLLDTLSRECARQSDAVGRLSKDVSRVSGSAQSLEAEAIDCADTVCQIAGCSEKMKSDIRSFKVKQAVNYTYSVKTPSRKQAKPAPAARPAVKPAVKSAVTAVKPAAAAAKPAPAPAARPAAPAPRPAAPSAGERKSEPMPTAIPEKFMTAQFIDVPDSKYC